LIPTAIAADSGQCPEDHGSGLLGQLACWQYGRPGGVTVFDFRLGRERAGPQLFLRNFQGVLQTDAYQDYDKVGGSGMVHPGCWTHARRGFANVVKLNPGDPVASPIVARINQLLRALKPLVRSRRYAWAPDVGGQTALFKKALKYGKSVVSS
jgi:transposase IS66 family protein